jgi:hypothetical protein
MTDHLTVSGTLANQTTLILDEPISLPAGRVRITVEPWPNTTFWGHVSVAELAAAQGVEPVESLDELWGDFWPEEETVDDFIEAIYQWRREAIEL